jgi:hypothetical protein
VVLALPLCDRGRLERNSAQQPAASAADIPQDWIGRNLARKLFSHLHRVSSIIDSMAGCSLTPFNRLKLKQLCSGQFLKYMITA